MDKKLNQALLVPPFLVFFIIFSKQVGISILDFPRKITEVAGYQSWTSILIAGGLISLTIWMMYYILNDQNGDLVEVHQNIFGKYIGFIPTMVYVVYLFFITIITIRTYILVVQMWMFPELPTWMLSLALLFIAYYAVLKGFRTLVGTSVLGLIIPFGLIFTAFYTLEYATFRSLFPLFNTTILEQIEATKKMTSGFLGPEILFVCYPFIKNAKASQKFAQFANVCTMLLYLFVAFFSFIFFAEDQIKEVLFPILTAWKVIKFPFIERFEYIGIAIWMIAVLPNIVFSVWGASRLLKRQTNIAHRKTLLFTIAIVFCFLIFFSRRERVEGLASFTSLFGLYLVYGYIPFLFLLVFIKKKIKKVKK